MKIIGVAASPRTKQSTSFILEQCLLEAQNTAEKQGVAITTETIDLAGKTVHGCISCGKCKKDLVCSQQDYYQEIIPKLADQEVKGIILATPVYMGSMTSQAKAFLDRSVLFRRNGFLFRNKLGAVITVGGSRNGGQEVTIQAVHAAMMIHDMIIVGDGLHFGGTAWSNFPGGYEKDVIGIDTAKATGKRVAETAMMLKHQSA